MKKPKVILRRCPDYNVDAISGIIRETIDDFNVRITGNVFIKPNVVTADRRYIHHAYTHPDVVEAMVRVVKDHQPENIRVGESCGFGASTKMLFKEAGYDVMAQRTGADVFDLNEQPCVNVALEKGVWHKHIMLPESIRNADVKIWMTKLKYHVFALITHALKLNVGILLHSERMLFHDYRIHDKIVDLLEVGYPDLVVSDMIDIGYGAECAPYPVRLGALMMADHPLAADVVAAHIMGFKPEEIQHLKIASERGYGSLDLDDIDISGDADIEALRAKPKGDSRLFRVLDDLDTKIDFYSGVAGDTSETCDGGCECSIKGCLGRIERMLPGSLKKAVKGAVVTGVYRGDVICPDGPVVMAGDCTEVKGRLEAEDIHYLKGCPVSSKDLFDCVIKIFKMPVS